MIGKTLAHYRIVEKIGEGGMGEVWRANDSKLGRDVALKMLPVEFVRDAERMARFRREAQVLASLNHPGIASIYGLEEQNDSHALVLELVQGPTLLDRLRRGPVPTGEAVGIALRLTEAVEYAHERGIVHRDLKPANIKVNDDGQVKVLDFGLAKALGDPATMGETDTGDSSESPTLPPTLQSPVAGALTGENVVLGTAAYMSPEQASGKTVDKRADIWSFGVILWEMLTGRALFQRESVPETLAAVFSDSPDLDQLPSGTPPSVRRLIARCLAPDPRLRLRDIGEARLVLASPQDEGTGPPARGRTVGLPLAAGAALAIAILVAATTWIFKPAGPDPPLRRLDLVAENVDLDWYIAPQLSPDGSRIAYSGNGRIWARDLTELEPRAIAEITDWTPVFWSPDGAFIGYASRRTLWRVPFEGGTPVAIATLPETGNIVGVDWHDDGTILLASWRGGLYRVSDTSGVPELLLPIDPETQVDFHHPSFLPGGSILKVTHWKSRAETGDDEPPFLSVFDGERDRPVELAGADDEAWPLYRYGHLFFLRSGPSKGIWAAPFDPVAARVTGTAFPVVPGAASISFADDGSLLYVEAAQVDATFELGWAESTGKWLGRIGTPRVDLEAPALSPDRTRVAFVAGIGEDREIYVHDLGRGTDRRLTFEPGVHDVPRWLGSDRILYATRIGTNSKVRLRAADGSGTYRDLHHEGGVGQGAAVLETTPDGHEFLQVIDAVGRGQVRRFDVPTEGLAGEGRRVLQGEPDPDVTEMRVSPDGSLMAYVSDVGLSAYEVFLTRFPSGDGTWQVSTRGGRVPRWDPETGALYYVSDPGTGQRSLVAVEIHPAEDVPVGSQRILFDLPQRGVPLYGFGGFYEIAPGGDRILLVRRNSEEDRGAERMVLIQNWRAEFERLVRDRQ